MHDTRLILPEWPAPVSVRACTSTRVNPELPDRPHQFNLATHVGDELDSVKANRESLVRVLDLSSQPNWLNQVHGCDVLEITKPLSWPETADAACTRMSAQACCVLTADCLPVLLCDKAGSVVAAVHAGWRGLQQNILRATILRMAVAPEELLAWLGPAISATAYEVDDAVYTQFSDPKMQATFQATRPGHWNLDLYAIARQQLADEGVNKIYGGEYCTYTQADLFFSYRREQQTGRMASLIWIQPE